MTDPNLHGRLTSARGSAAARVAALEVQFATLVEAGNGTNIDDEHDPEGATIAFERAQVGALLEQARERVRELDRALDLLSQGAYGICEKCGRPIAAGRLEARPAARTCIDCATKH
jgi:RNA polymerase-binding transcription factor DksA